MNRYRGFEDILNRMNAIGSEVGTELTNVVQQVPTSFYGAVQPQLKGNTIPSKRFGAVQPQPIITIKEEEEAQVQVEFQPPIHSSQPYDSISPLHPFPDLESTITGMPHSPCTKELNQQFEKKRTFIPIEQKSKTIGHSTHKKSHYSYKPIDVEEDIFGIYYTLPKCKMLVDSSLKEEERNSKWHSMVHSKFVRKTNDVDMMPAFKFEHDSRFEENVWKGIPLKWRKNAWNDMSTEFSGFYSSLSRDQVKWLNSEIMRKYRDLCQVSQSPYEKEIAKAVQRGLIRHVALDSNEGKDALKRLLCAVCLANSEVGFVPGLENWVGLFYTIFGEELSFFMIQRMFYCRKVHSSFSFYNLKSLYLKNDVFIKENIYIHNQLLRMWVPKVYDQFCRYEIHSGEYLKIWYQSLFTSCSAVSIPFLDMSNSHGGLLPWCVLLRVWDLFLFYGWDILCIVSISILKIYKDEIAMMDPATIRYFFGIERQGTAMELGIASNDLPTITHSDKFLELVNQLYFTKRKVVLMDESMKHSNSLSDSVCGRELIPILRQQFTS